MRWSAGIIICLIFVSVWSQAQRPRHGTINGTVIDSSSHQPLELASVTVYLDSDSSLLNYTLSDHMGEFNITGIPFNSKCVLVITASGYDVFFRPFMLSPENKEKRLDTIKLVKAYRELKSVTITAQRPPLAVKQDTLEFNVSAFNTMPNSMLEDLLKQLPGVDFDNEGNITINGKKVTKLYIDGQEFFGGDPKIAIKNLPKDIIDKLQVMDNKSREARFNKITNGNEDLAVNLILKKEVQKGWFGRGSAGYGSNERYEGNAILNFFNGSKQLNIIGNTNNTNRGNISGNDFNISNASNTLSADDGGLTRATSGGVNFSDNLGKQVKLNSSYLFQNSNIYNFSRIQRKNNLPDTSFYYHADNRSNNENTTHRLSLVAEYDVDTLTELHVNSYVNTNGHSGVTLNEASSNRLTEELINTSQNSYRSKDDAKYIAAEFFFSHRLRKSGRSFALGFNYSYNDMSSSNNNIGQNDYYTGGAVDSTDLIDQRNVEKKSGRILSATTTYTEPINKHIIALIRYNYNRNTSFSDKITNSFNSITGKYDIEDSAFTNEFNNVTKVHSSDVSLIFTKNQYHGTIGSGLQFLQRDNVIVTTGAFLHQSYVSLTPSANFQYDFNKSSNVSIFYNGRSQQPSLQQLQPVLENSNPLYLQLGNPDLRQSFSHNIIIQLRGSKGSSYWVAALNFNIIQNDIVNETQFDDVGKQISHPINVNGNYGMSNRLQYSRTWNNMNATLRMNLSSNGYFNRNISFVNKIRVTSASYTLSESAGLNFTYKQLLSIMPSFNIRYSRTRYSSESMQDLDLNAKTFSMSAFLNYPKWLIVENNLQYNYNSEIAPGFRKSITMWSAALNFLVFKRKQGTARLAVYDILKQNAGVYRSFTPTYTEDRQTQFLPRYLLLSFIYNLRKSGSK